MTRPLPVFGSQAQEPSAIDGIPLYPAAHLVSSAYRDMGEPLARHNAGQVQKIEQLIQDLPASGLPQAMQQQAKSALKSLLADVAVMTAQADHDSAAWVLDPTAAKVDRLRQSGFSEAAFRTDRLDSPVTNFASIFPEDAQLKDKLFRGGQPSPNSLPWLKKQGIKTIISFRDPVTEPETAYPGFSMAEYKKAAEGMGLQYFSLGFKDRSTDFADKVDRFLKILNDPDNWPIYIHCRAGLGRTGLMSAAAMKARGYGTQHVYETSLHRGLRPSEFADHARQMNEILKLQVPTPSED